VILHSRELLAALQAQRGLDRTECRRIRRQRKALGDRLVKVSPEPARKRERSPSPKRALPLPYTDEDVNILSACFAKVGSKATELVLHVVKSTPARRKLSVSDALSGKISYILQLQSDQGGSEMAVFDQHHAVMFLTKMHKAWTKHSKRGDPNEWVDGSFARSVLESLCGDVYYN
jgi:hypothetical protein